MCRKQSRGITVIVTVSARVNRPLCGTKYPLTEKIERGERRREEDWKPGPFVKIDGTSTEHPLGHLEMSQRPPRHGAEITHPNPRDYS
jgi:hypothetical protein